MKGLPIPLKIYYDDFGYELLRFPPVQRKIDLVHMIYTNRSVFFMMMLLRRQRVLKTNDKRGHKDGSLAGTTHPQAQGQQNRNQEC